MSSDSSSSKGSSPTEATRPDSPTREAEPRPAAPRRRRRSGGVIQRLVGSLFASLFILSIALNIYLSVLVYRMVGGPSEEAYQPGDSSRRIVILPIEGLIDDTTDSFVRNALEQLQAAHEADNDQIGAVILRINSPGGYVPPSDRIWNEIKQFKAETQIPIVASFGNYAASGGYYVAAPADVIVAEYSTVTGSIGVIAQAITYDRLLEKVGITPEIIASTQATEKAAMSPMRPWTEEDRDKLRVFLDVAHERFVHVVHDGRQHVLDEPAVRALATGAAYTSLQAVELKLVDEIGYLDRAIEIAAEKAQIPTDQSPNVTIIRQPKPFSLGTLLGATGPSLDQVNAQQVRDLMTELAAPQMMYHLNWR